MTPERLTQPFHIVCEGRADYEFLRHLIDARGIQGFEIGYPEKDRVTHKGCFGKDGFAEYLGALLARQPEIETVKGVLVVTDSDNDPKTAFDFVKKKIKEAEDYKVPEELLKPAKSRKAPQILVATIPWIDEPGNLETLVLKAVEQSFGEIWKCLETYYQCSDAQSWDIGKQSKMKMSCAIAALCKDDPSCAMSIIWSKSVFKSLLGLNCFDRLADFLGNAEKVFGLDKP